jgi:cobalt/nickel transport system permease protein
MHISEGVLPPSLLFGGAALGLLGVGIGLKKMNQHEVPLVGLLTAAFFVGSLIHVPLGPVSGHLVLNGLVGLIIGWACFPALLVALLLQALFFQYGGITVLGVNTVNMALPALLLSLACRPLIRSDQRLLGTLGAFAAGGGAVLGSGLMVAGCLSLAGEAFIPAAQAVLAAHVPVMLIEGIVAVFALGFIKRVKPEMLHPSKESRW